MRFNYIFEGENKMANEFVPEHGLTYFNDVGRMHPFLKYMMFFGLAALVVLFIWGMPDALAGVSLPGEDKSSDMKAAGTLLKILDTGIFQWGARLFAGLCILSAGWALKEQMFATAAVCIVGAITFGTAPHWVQNIFSVSGASGLFGSINIHELLHTGVALCA
ncbi:MAG: hypothetical protein AB7F43_12470 [Bacteriovoracia bacterium]